MNSHTAHGLILADSHTKLRTNALKFLSSSILLFLLFLLFEEILSRSNFRMLCWDDTTLEGCSRRSL
jgi:hypothetical protein